MTLAASLGAADLSTRPEYATAPARSKNRDALNAEISALTEKKSTDTWVRELNGRPLRADLFHRPDVRGRSGQASRHRLGRAERREPPHPPGRSAGHPLAHPEQDGGTAAGVRRADRGGAGRVRVLRGRDRGAEAEPGGLRPMPSPAA